MSDREQISQGFKDSTGDSEWKRFMKWLGGFKKESPEQGVQVEERVERPLAEEIAGVGRMVTEPASSSAD